MYDIDMPKKKREYKTIRVSLETYNRIVKLAHRKGQTLLATLQDLLK